MVRAAEGLAVKGLRLGGFVTLSASGQRHFDPRRRAIYGRVLGFGRGPNLVRIAHLGAKTRHTYAASLWTSCKACDIPADLLQAEQRLRPFTNDDVPVSAVPDETPVESTIKPGDAGAPHVYWRGEWIPCW